MTELTVECPCFQSPVMGGPLQKVIDSVSEVDDSFHSVQLDNSVIKICASNRKNINK